MHCELMEGCSFFNGLHQGSVNVLKQIYCKNNSASCARRQVAVAVGHEHIPLDLAPKHTHRVQEIINDVLSRR